MTESKQPTKAEALEALDNVFSVYVRDKRLAYGQLEIIRRFIQQVGTAPHWRDELAARAMQGVLSSTGTNRYAHVVAGAAYDYADAMLAYAPTPEADHD